MWAAVVVYIVVFLSSCLLALKLSSYKRSPSSSAAATKKLKLPPGPKPLPIIGNLLQLGQRPHQSLQDLSKIHGPIMTLKLGMTRNTIVISSPHFAKQILQRHDDLFSDRTVSDTIRVLDHHNLSVAMLPVSPQWRKIRKVMATQMFSQARLDASQPLRLQKVQELIRHIRNTCSDDQTPLELEHAVFITVLNFLSNTLFSADLAHYRSEQSQEFKHLVAKMLELGGKGNFSDYFPVLKYLDPQGLRRANKAILSSIIRVFEDIIDQRMRSGFEPNETSCHKDVLDVLLDQGEDGGLQKLTTQEIKHLCADLYIAGADSTSGTVEWAMTELMRNPSKLAKAQAELSQAIPMSETIQESDITNLPYLQAIIKETLRLHSPTPLLLPHKAQTDVEISGFLVPKGSQVLINVWAMGRDPALWRDALAFEPERFLDSDIDYRGQNFDMIPFGAGRRICPGLSLAHRMIPLILGSLLHSFRWRLEDGVKPEDVDVSDKFGITLHKRLPLRIIPIPRNS
uniref:Cytochrome P450 n=1 Tax=Kalanchoe fedtschenkoi TaxID=63787 RepID=A0A7N0T4M0_KALFE